MTRPRLAAGLAALVACGALAAGAAAQTPRQTADLPDDVVGPAQLHVVYAVASDGPDRQLDVAGEISASVSAFQRWLDEQTGGRQLRVDTAGGAFDVTFVRLAATAAAIEQQGGAAVGLIGTELRSTFNGFRKIYAVYYDGAATGVCGSAQTGGRLAAVYLRTRGCDATFTTAAGQRQNLVDIVTIHELLHVLGFVPRCAPHSIPGGHVNDSPQDLMSSGEVNDWQHSVLDAGHDDYFLANIPGCPDLSTNPFLSGAEFPLELAPPSGTTIRVFVDGASGPVCPPSCRFTFETGARVVLSTSAPAASVFRGWSGSCTGTVDCQLTMDAPKSATAVFGPPPRFRVAVTVRGGGTVTAGDGTIRCPRVCAATYLEDEGVSLRARAKPGWTFTGWSGACKGKAACSLTTERNRSVVAAFKRTK